jgi:integrase
MATIQKRGKSYRIRVSVGYDSAGKQIIKSMTWRPEPSMTPKQIENKLKQVVRDFEVCVINGQYLDGAIKFSDFAEKWLTDYAEKQLAPSTVVGYRRYLKRINAAIGHIRLDKLQPQHLIEFYNNISEAGARADFKCIAIIDLADIFKKRVQSRKIFAKENHVSEKVLCNACHGQYISYNSAKAICDGLGLKFSNVFKITSKGKLSGNSILHYHHLISSILTTAVQWQVITSNPAKRIKPPKMERKEAAYLDVEQARQLIELLENEPIQYKTAIILLLYSGMRRGELLGLEWRDFDFDNCTVCISRTSQYLPGKGVFTKGTKTSGSTRIIKLPKVILKLLHEYRKWQNEERLKVGSLWHDTDRLFTTWDGKPMRPDTLTQWFENFVKRHNLPPIHLHSLRHTNATMLIAAGEDVRTIAGRLGHSQTSTTLNIYSHVIQSADAKAARTIENLLDPLNAKKNKNII